MSSGLAHARRRHPSARWPAPVDALRQRVAQLLDLHGARHPDVAASLLEARGRRGCEQVEFARRLDVDVDLLRRAEAGEVSAAALPERLRRMVSSD
ncbi:hypothetical protein [Actinospongicola halichondriae]|uniref:hypothetical protein n=1 Tax=Actinospongicola halichondriae TaxID=3236844 RepID=UPI003D5AC25E